MLGFIFFDDSEYLLSLFDFREQTVVRIMGNVECISYREDIYKYDNKRKGWSDPFIFRLSGMSDIDVAKLKSNHNKIDDDNTKPLLQDPSILPNRYSLQRRSTVNAALLAAHKTLREPIGEHEQSPITTFKTKSLSKSIEKLPITITRRNSDPKTITIQRTKSGGSYVISRTSVKQLKPDLECCEIIDGEENELVESESKEELTDDDTMTFTIATPSILNHGMLGLPLPSPSPFKL